MKKSNHIGLREMLLIAGGIVSLMLGVLGLFLPLLPTTPFLLLAAYCFARSSKNLYHWTITNRWFGKYVWNYIEGKGVPLRQKMLTIIFLWGTIAYAAVFIVAQLWIRILLSVIAISVTIHIVLIKTYRKKSRV